MESKNILIQSLNLGDQLYENYFAQSSIQMFTRYSPQKYQFGCCGSVDADLLRYYLGVSRNQLPYKLAIGRHSFLDLYATDVLEYIALDFRS